MTFCLLDCYGLTFEDADTTSAATQIAYQTLLKGQQEENDLMLPNLVRLAWSASHRFGYLRCMPRTPGPPAVPRLDVVQLTHPVALELPLCGPVPRRPRMERPRDGSRLEVPAR